MDALLAILTLSMQTFLPSDFLSAFPGHEDRHLTLIFGKSEEDVGTSIRSCQCLYGHLCSCRCGL